MLEALSHRLAAFLSREGHVHGTSPPTNQEFLKRVLRPADVLLVEGTSLIAAGIKYLTQSTWSHAAIFVGDAMQGTSDCMFVEADLMEGVRSVGLQKYAGYHCRVCRPVGLSESDVKRVVAYAIAQVGHAYDKRNIVDLARYLLPTPPVPSSWRRKMIAFRQRRSNARDLFRTYRPVVRNDWISCPSRCDLLQGGAQRLSRLRGGGHAGPPS